MILDVSHKARDRRGGAKRGDAYGMRGQECKAGTQSRYAKQVRKRPSCKSRTIGNNYPKTLRKKNFLDKTLGA